MRLLFLSAQSHYFMRAESHFLLECAAKLACDTPAVRQRKGTRGEGKRRREDGVRGDEDGAPSSDKQRPGRARIGWRPMR
ncbi:hypothetical protein EDWATA_03377, partial [Edwardsiella tarda ATCC 23685]